MATWTKQEEWKGHRDPVSTLTFGPNGRLYSGSSDTTVMVRDVTHPKR